MDSSVVISLIFEICHYSGFFLLVGTSVVLDLRLMGVAAQREPVPQLARQLRPWMWTGLVMVLVSGFFMFAGDAVDFYGAGTFRVKLLIVLVAVGFGIFVNSKAAASSEEPSISSIGAKVVAFLSLVLWIGSILISVEVPAISGVG
ncbi:MAG TPA: DUF6644 family protein [Candidatus Acidoferrales bacterium]|nr:DUF6644 family protein [Candidatus Acidoferrales bacterium]